MPEAFRTSDEFDEHAHHLYNQGRYDDVLSLLKEGLAVYPNAAELHVGMAYAHLAREDYAWARRSFELAVALDPDQEDGLAGLGETLLKFGDQEGAIRAFDRLVALGFARDAELMLQVGRALFREGLIASAHRFFELAAAANADSAPAAACLGYAVHRLGNEAGALYWLRRALAIDPGFTEARIYLANLLYDRGESEAALRHFERTEPDDHYEELGIWRHVDLKRTTYRLREGDPELAPWMARLQALAGEPDAIDLLLAEVEAGQADGSMRDPQQLELFGALLSELQTMQRRAGSEGAAHQVITLTGEVLRGTWDDILLQLQAADRERSGDSLRDFMAWQAERGRAETGAVIPTTGAEAFIRGSADAGIVRIVY